MPPDAASPSSTPPVVGGPAASAPALDGSLEADLAIMRAHDQSQWGPPAEPAIESARRVFAAVHFEGMTTAEVVRLIEPPMTKEEGDSVWTYAFHDGEAGVIRRLHIADGKVASVQTVMTQ